MGESDGEGQTARELRVVSANVRTSLALDLLHPWRWRREALATVLEAQAFDLCGLQEVRPNQLAWLTERFADRLGGVEVSSEGRKGDGRDEHGTLLTRRARLRVERVEPRWFSDTPDVAGSKSWGNDFPRFALLVELTDLLAPAGRDARLLAVVVHLDHRSKRSRQRSCEALARWLDESAVRSWIVVGDLNVPVDDAALDPLRALGLHDAHAHLPAEGVGASTFHGYPGGHDGKRIDAILASADWEVVTAEIVHDRPDGRLPSDHWPIAATLRRT